MTFLSSLVFPFPLTSQNVVHSVFESNAEIGGEGGE